MSETMMAPRTRLRSAAAILFAVFFLFNSIMSPVPGVTVGELLLAAATLLTFFDGAGASLEIHDIHRDMLLLALSCIVLTFVTAAFQPVFSASAFAIRAIRWSFYILCAGILGKRLDMKAVGKAIFFIAAVSSIFLIFQVAVYRLTGRIIELQVGAQTLGCSIENTYSAGKLTGRIVRFSAFFSEPARFSYYAVLALAIALFDRENTGMSFWTVAEIAVILIALILCTSTYAILLCTVLLGMYLVLLMQYRGVTRRAIACFMALFIAGIALLYLFRNSILGGYFVRKLTTIGSTSRTSFIWQEDGLFSTLQNVLGVGVGNEETYYAYLRNDTLGYMNSISLMFSYSGIFGVALMVLFYVKAWAGLRNHSRVVLLLLAAMSLFSTAFVSPMMVLYTVVIAAGDSASSWCDNKEREPQN